MPINHFTGDPYWTKAKFRSTCVGCTKTINRGEKIFYYPKTKTVYCSECGEDAHAEFTQAAEDEYAVTGPLEDRPYEED